jgi:hypothetical protein
MKEILNRVVEAEKVDKLTVFGGLDGVLKDVVRIQVPDSQGRALYPISRWRAIK